MAFMSWTIPFRTAPSSYIHLELAAGLLGITPEELAPILQEQQEFL
jgi:hypothetical protein